jgi:hypothetical protein
MITINFVMHVKKKRISNSNLAKLVTSLLEEPFMKWGLDFMEAIKPA